MGSDIDKLLGKDDDPKKKKPKPKPQPQTVVIKEKAPELPKENPRLVREREEEEARTRQARIESIQEQLATETLLRGRRFGVRSLLGSFGFGGRRGGGRRTVLGTG